MSPKRVVVTGLGAITPLGNSVPDFWNSAISGVSGAATITRFDTTEINTKTKFACEVKDFNIEDWLDRKEVRKLDRYSHFAFVSAAQAIADSKLDLETACKERIGVILGVGIGGLESLEDGINIIYGQKTNNQELKVTPFFIPRLISNMAAGYIALHYGFKGPNFVTSSACASSNHAIIEAAQNIALGKADVIITGGSESVVVDSALCGFNVMHALSTRNDSPETASRPLSASRDGFVMGEGGGCIVLEEYGHAVARGAHIYAEFAGSGMTNDAYHMTAPDPEGTGAIRVMELAIEDAGMTPSDIDYINMHGTSTPLGDVAECNAILKVFGDHAYNLNLSATKSMTGHLLGGAGAIEAILSILAIQEGVIPPTINHSEDDTDPQIDYRMNFTFNKAQKRDVRAALSNTFGFGGHNACVIFKRSE